MEVSALALGDLTVVDVERESLGFDVERLGRNPPWVEHELILALDLYVRAGLLQARDRAVRELSDELNALTIHSERPDATRFRNPNGVALNLANFAALDPNYQGRGMTRGSRLAAKVWSRYSGDEDTLAEAAAALREGREPPKVGSVDTRRSRVIKAEVEAQHVERFPVSLPAQVAEATRREQTLVLGYRDHLRALGHEVNRHIYPLPASGSQLACDLVDETDSVLYEAKGDVRRPSVRMAIGQLLDYRRLEATPIQLAVLLPREPAQELIALIHSVPAATVWRTRDGFATAQPPAPDIASSEVTSPRGVTK